MSDKPRDISAALAAMERLSKLPLRYIPAWERSDRDEPARAPEPNSHMMVQIGGRLYESDGSGSIHRIR